MNCLVLLALVVAAPAAGDWPQFRGPNATGVYTGNGQLPDKVGPRQNVLWKVPLPAGHSSPVVVGDRVYLTAARDGTVLVLALDRRTGRTLWERAYPFRHPEQHHQIGNHAQPSPAADGEVVVSFFGCTGLFCHDRDGRLLWQKPLGPFKNDYGTGASPVIAGDRVLLSQDHDTGSFLLALEKMTGRELWKADRSEFPRNYATPVVWDVDGKKQVVVSGTLRAVGYDFDTGKELWTVRGLARIVNMTPVVGPDNTLYIPAWTPGGDPTDRIEAPAWAEALAGDADKNGTLEEAELPAGPVRQRFMLIDRDKDGHISRDEWEYMRRIFSEAQNVLVAVRPGGRGDVTRSHVVWEQRKQLPYVPSPVCVNGHLFLVKNGGIVSCLDAKTGRPTRVERVFGVSDYYASPVAGDGKIYLVSRRGDVSVITAEPQWKELSHDKLGEEVFATPALAHGCVFVRTAGHLYCFGTVRAGPGNDE
jgi:outer membrane protein assembly factor BamB